MPRNQCLGIYSCGAGTVPFAISKGQVIVDLSWGRPVQNASPLTWYNFFLVHVRTCPQAGFRMDLQARHRP